MIVCLQVPRFALTVAAGRDAQLTAPLALAPEPGREPVVGEASAAAEAFGVRAGMRLGEALARCPGLKLVPPDPAGVADAHDLLLRSLEAVGAAVESGRPGLAFLDAHALRHIHGDLSRVVAVTRRAAAHPARAGAAPTRFAALAAASRARARKPEVVDRRGIGRFLAPLSVDLLQVFAEGRGDHADAALAALPEPLSRLGVGTLGELAALPRGAVADRFGATGLRARELAGGKDQPLRPRQPVEQLEEELELPESASGPQLEQALGLLIDRLLARRDRRGRALRAVVVSAALVEGGTWRTRMTFREPLADPRRMRLVLFPRLVGLPAPADVLRLRAEGFGPPTGDQGALLTESSTARTARLREAIRQTRVAAGPDAALRVLAVDPDSRVPERRLVLAPWET